jgi:hypothetical protein
MEHPVVLLHAMVKNIEPNAGFEGVSEDQLVTCIQNCTDCHAVCTQALLYSYETGNEYAEPSHLVLLQDCADICQLSATFMLRESERHADVCRVCADICRDAAESCEQFKDDEMMAECAQVCRDCADSCERMAR